MAGWEDDVRRDLLDPGNHVPAGITREVLQPQIEPYKGAKTIQIVTPNYPTWLKRADPNRTIALRDSVMDFRRRRKNYTKQVSDLLEGIIFYDTGFALIDAISSSGKDLFIRPWTVFGEQGKIDANAGTIDEKTGQVNSQEKVLAAISTGMLNYDAKGRQQPGSGLGLGSDAVINFSADIFGTPAAKALYSGPASGTDEILFHEMVHASRLMTGTFYLMPVSQGYTNEEEYLGIVLTNVFMSEKHQTDFRARHQLPNIKLLQPEKFLDNIQGVDLSPIVMIERFRLNNPKFYQAYADIEASSAPFNPIREFDERKAAGKIRFH